MSLAGRDEILSVANAPTEPVNFDKGAMVATDDNARRGRGAFFGRRKGHRLRPRQAERVERLLPRLAVDLSQPPPVELRRLFPEQTAQVNIEIGFGGGEHLVEEAQAHPQTGFIGCEPFINGMAKALAQIEARGLANLRVHAGDATELIAWLPDASLARVDLIFPDPWPKRRHWKRRFVQDASVAEIARVLRPGGIFRFASDVPDYVVWTLERLARSPAFVWTAERADDWRQPWRGFVETRYQAKAQREGRVPSYLEFRRRA